MDIYDSVHALAKEIRESEVSLEYARLKQIAEEDETNRALLAEYKRLQMVLQMRAMSGQPAEPDDADRFAKIASLLYMNSDAQGFMMAEMRLQKLLADCIKILSEACGMNMELPGA